MPLFNHSETSNSFLTDLKSLVFTEIHDFFDNFNRFLYETPSNNIKEIVVKPEISPVVLADNLDVLGDFLEKKISKIDEIITGHKDMIASLLVFDERTIITGSKYEIKLWDLGFHHNFSSFTNDFPINFLCSFEGNEDEIQGKTNIFKRILTKNTGNCDKCFLVSCDNSDSAIKIWDIEKKTVIRSFFIEKINAILAIKDGQTLISGSKDGKIRLWNVNTGKTIQILNEHKGEVNCLFLLRDGDRFASGGNDHSIRIWRLFSGFSLRNQRKTVEKTEFVMILENNCAVLSLNQSFLDENMMFSGGIDGILRIWDLKQKKWRKDLKTENNGVLQMVLCENVWDNKGNKRVSVMGGEGLEVWDSSGDEKIEIKVICGGNLQIVKRGDEGIELIGCKDRNVTVLKLC